jgi:hypothetical protein
MQIIFIAGPARVGKTALAEFLARETFELGMVPVLLSFAGPIKQQAKALGYSKKETPDTYRTFCQKLGAEKREENPDHWVNLFEQELLKIYDAEIASLKVGDVFWERCVLVDDCRYTNELELGHKYKGNIVYLSPGSRELEEMTASWRSHHSEDLATKAEQGDEKVISRFTHVVLNDGDLRNLQLKSKTMAPIWCGIQASHDECCCASCQARRKHESTPGDLHALVEEIIDLILLSEDEASEDDNDNT